MSNPLNEQIAQLISEIMKLEAERDAHRKRMEGIGLLSDIAEESREKHRSEFIKLDEFTRKIDFSRQKLISMELLMLDNSIKSLQSTMGQVDGSVKALQTTAVQTLTSSKKLERLTNILIFVTILLAIIGIYNISIVLYPTNPLVGWTGTLGSGVLIVYALLRFLPVLRKKA